MSCRSCFEANHLHAAVGAKSGADTTCSSLQEAEKCKSVGAGLVEVETTNLMDDKAVDDLCAKLLEVRM